MGENRLTGAGNPVRRLSKTRLLSHLQCPRRLWLETFRPELAATSAATAAAFSAGNSVGAVARRIYGGSDGVLIDTGTDTAAALAATTEILQRGACGPLFEAAFEYGGVLIRADVLVPLLGRRRWGDPPMLLAAAWLAREAFKLRRERERLQVSRMFYEEEAAKHQRQVRYLRGEFDGDEEGDG